MGLSITARSLEWNSHGCLFIKEVTRGRWPLLPCEETVRRQSPIRKRPHQTLASALPLSFPSSRTFRRSLDYSICNSNPTGQRHKDTLTTNMPKLGKPHIKYSILVDKSTVLSRSKNHISKWMFLQQNKMKWLSTYTKLKHSVFWTRVTWGWYNLAHGNYIWKPR